MIDEADWINLPVGYNLEDHTNVRSPLPEKLWTVCLANSEL